MCLVSTAELTFLRDPFNIFVDIANHIIENPKELALDFQGIWIADREFVLLSSPTTMVQCFVIASLSWDVVQEQIPAVDFVHKYEHVFSFKYVIQRIGAIDTTYWKF